MEKTVVDFVKVLRTAEVKVSPAETLDAMAALEVVGYQDRTLFKNTLSMLLSKNPDEKETFEACFEKFFTFDDVTKTSQDEQQTEAGEDQFDDEQDGNGQPGQPGGKGSGQGGQSRGDHE